MFALCFGRSNVNCGWSVDGTVAAGTRRYEYFWVLHFGHATRTRNANQAKERNARNHHPGDDRRLFYVRLSSLNRAYK
jgi:hypothetical protein